MNQLPSSYRARKRRRVSTTKQPSALKSYINRKYDNILAEVASKKEQ